MSSGNPLVAASVDGPGDAWSGVWIAEDIEFGLATPLVVEQVSTLIASWAAKIARWLRSLIGSLPALAGQSQLLERLIEALKKILAKLRGKGEEPAKDPAGAGGEKAPFRRWT